FLKPYPLTHRRPRAFSRPLCSRRIIGSCQFPDDVTAPPARASPVLTRSCSTPSWSRARSAEPRSCAIAFAPPAALTRRSSTARASSPDGRAISFNSGSAPPGRAVFQIMRVAVDAMGGDAGPRPAVEGAILAAQRYNIDVALVGKPRHLQRLLAAMKVRDGRISIVEA